MSKNQIEYQELIDIIKSMASDDELLSFFLRALENKNLKICQLCLDAGININIRSSRNLTLFQHFVSGGKFDREVADWLIEHGADMNIYNVHTNLDIACYDGNYDMAKYFIEKGIKIRQGSEKERGNTHNESNLYISVLGGNYEIVKMLIDHGVNIDYDAYSFAVERHKHKIVELFLQNGANTECYFDYFTPLHYAVYRNDIILAEILLKNNANVNAIIKEEGRIIDDDYAITPMDIAQIKNNEEMQNLLIKFGGKTSSEEEKKLGILESSSSEPKYTKALKKLLQRSK